MTSKSYVQGDRIQLHIDGSLATIKSEYYVRRPDGSVYHSFAVVCDDGEEFLLPGALLYIASRLIERAPDWEEKEARKRARKAKTLEKIIAFEFDSVCVKFDMPNIGDPLPGAVEVLRRLQADGHKLILWTTRSGKFLDDAKQWFRDRGITLYATNENPGQMRSMQSPKIAADVIIDPRGLGTPMLEHEHMGRNGRPSVDWWAIQKNLYYAGLLSQPVYMVPRRRLKPVKPHASA